MSRAADQSQQDRADLGRFGYAQELFRSMGGFSNFAISFSIISILTGAVTLFGYGLEMGGPLEMTLGWPLATVFTLAVAASMAELCSAYPDRRRHVPLGGGAGRRRVGMVGGLAQIFGLIATQAGINYSCAQFVLPFLGLPSTTLNLLPDVRLHPADAGRPESLRRAPGGHAQRSQRDRPHPGRGGRGGGADVVRARNSRCAFLLQAVNSNGRSPYCVGLLLGLLQAQWTYTGFDASAHMAEETEDPRRRAPWGIVLSVAVRAWWDTCLILALTLAIQHHPRSAWRRRMRMANRFPR